MDTATATTSATAMDTMDTTARGRLMLSPRLRPLPLLSPATDTTAMDTVMVWATTATACPTARGPLSPATDTTAMDTATDTDMAITDTTATDTTATMARGPLMPSPATATTATVLTVTATTDTV